jgi:hypothetical protein
MLPQMLQRWTFDDGLRRWYFPRPAPSPPKSPGWGYCPPTSPIWTSNPLRHSPAHTHLHRLGVGASGGDPDATLLTLVTAPRSCAAPPPSPVAPCPVNVPRQPPPAPRPASDHGLSPLTTSARRSSRRRHTPPHLPLTSCCTNGVRSTKIATKLEHTRALRNEAEVGWGWVRVVRHATQRCPAFTETLPMLTSNMFL